MPKIFFNAQGYLTVNGAPTAGAFECGENDELLIASCAGADYLPVMAKVRLKNGCPLPCDGIKTIAWQRGVFSLVIKSRRYYPPAPPSLRLCRSLSCRGVEHMLTVFEQGGYFFTIETREETFTARIPLESVDSADIYARAIDGGVLIMLKFCAKRRFFFCLFYSCPSCICKLNCFFQCFSHNNSFHCLSYMIIPTFKGEKNLLVDAGNFSSLSDLKEQYSQLFQLKGTFNYL